MFLLLLLLLLFLLLSSIFFLVSFVLSRLALVVSNWQSETHIVLKASYEAQSEGFRQDGLPRHIFA